MMTNEQATKAIERIADQYRGNILLPLCAGTQVITIIEGTFDADQLRRIADVMDEVETK